MPGGQGLPVDGTCKSCGAPVIWGKTEQGRAIPLDAKPLKRFVAVTTGTPPLMKLLDTYATHFFTCPEAKKHRKARQASRSPQADLLTPRRPPPSREEPPPPEAPPYGR